MSVEPIVPQGSPGGPRGVYRKTAATRARILDAALEIFGAAGFEGGSLREVADRAGISQAGLLHHYPTKVALLSAILQRRDDAAEEAAEGIPPGVERLAALVDYAREGAARPTEIAVFAVLSAEATRSVHPAHDYMRRRYEAVTAMLRQSFVAAGEAGDLQPGRDPDALAADLIALWDGLQVQWLMGVNDIDVARGVERFLDLHLVAPLRDLVARQRLLSR